jgi:hypothetical protein
MMLIEVEVEKTKLGNCDKNEVLPGALLQIHVRANWAE